MTKPTLLIRGMHGMGDCLHQRAVLRQRMRTHSVHLQTSWASMYHDLVVEGLHLIRQPVALRTQTKNANREQHLFGALPRGIAETLSVAYSGAGALATKSGTVLEAMCNVTGTDYATADYRLPVPLEWFDGLEPLIISWRASGKPLMIYRPLVVRPEWRGSALRNADPVGYAKLLASIRDNFFVISVADLEPGKEWIVGPQFIPDATYHKGELSFENMAALFAQADLVFTSSGYAAILAPAVGTPCVSIIGGYETVGCHQSGERFAPFLSIGPPSGCSCWTQRCRQPCDKTLALGVELPRLREFLSEKCSIFLTEPTRPWGVMHTNSADPSALAQPFGSPPDRSSPTYQLYLQQMRGAAQRIEGKA